MAAPHGVAVPRGPRTRPLCVSEPPGTPTAADLAAVADRLDKVLAQGEPEQTKALLRILIVELRVNNKTEIQPTYRIVAPGVCATSEKVETAGIEPAQRSRRE